MARGLAIGAAFTLVFSFSAIGLSRQEDGKTTNFALVDKEGTKDWAVAFPVPAGWRTDGKLTWSANPANPVSYFFTTASPDWKQSVSWTSGFVFGFTNRHGLPTVGKPLPQKPSDFLVEYVGGLLNHQPFQVLNRTDQPTQTPAPQIKGMKAFAFHSTINLTSTIMGQLRNAQLSYDLYVTAMPVPGGMTGNWRASNIEYVSAEPEKLDEAAHRLESIMSGASLNPKFVEAQRTVTKALFKKEQTQMQRQRALNASLASHRHSYNREEFNNSMRSRSLNAHLFTLHEEIRGYNSHVFSYMEGNYPNGHLPNWGD